MFYVGKLYDLHCLCRVGIDKPMIQLGIFLLAYFLLSMLNVRQRTQGEVLIPR
jgi:hypothetical protein